MQTDDTVPRITAHTVADIFVDIDRVFVMMIGLKAFLLTEGTVDAVTL